MTPDKIFLLVSMLSVLAATGFAIADFFASSETAAGLRRRRTSKIAAALLFLAAAGSTAAAAAVGGDDADFGYGAGVIWFVFAMFQLTTVPQPSRIRELEQKQAAKIAAERQAELKRVVAATNQLAEEFGLPPLAPITEPHPEGKTPR